MLRIELLLPILFWLAWVPGEEAPLARPGLWIGIFFGVYLLLIIAVRVISLRAVGQMGQRPSPRLWSRLNRMGRLLVWLVPGWFVYGSLELGWRTFVGQTLGLDRLGLGQWGMSGSADLAIQAPSMLVGIWPAYLAMVGIWWAMYPTDRAVRETNLLIELSEDMPVRRPPSVRQLLINKLRMQMLVTLLPVSLAVAGDDLLHLVVHPLVMRHAPGQAPAIDAILSLCVVATLMIMSPEILRRILHTQPLPDSPLRQRLLDAAKRHKIRCRDILLWNTYNDVGNAAVMGLIPRFRYVLLSDLLVQTMPDEQIEAVFAHEAGHVVHRHLQWYVVLLISLAMGLGGLSDMSYPWLQRQVSQQWITWIAGTMAGGLMVLGFYIFIKVSQAFERQADVFAARAIQQSTGSFPQAAESFAGIDRLQLEADVVGRDKVVLPYGATIVAAALHRVAVINNIPIGARNLTHGSILTRMNVLREMSQRPESTESFDRAMRWIRLGILFWLAVAVGLTVWLG